MEAAAASGDPGVPRSFRIGASASAAMALFYALVVGGVSGSARHLIEQVRTDWYLLLPIMAGFGVQVGLLAELRRRRRMHRGVAAAGMAGAGASTVGMVACCAHHLADLAPFVGATAAATFLYDYRLPFILVGLGVNAAGVVAIARRLRSLPGLTNGSEEETCAIEGSR